MGGLRPRGAPVVRAAVPPILPPVLLGFLLALCCVLAGCGGAGVRPDPSPTSGGSPSVTPTAPTIPADGYGLRAFGIANGPAQFSVPRGSVASTIVDQPNNVVLVLIAPTPAAVADYLVRTLPGAGFTITDADPGDDTFTFDGRGWAGSFTVGRADQTAAVLLRPI